MIRKVGIRTALTLNNSGYAMIRQKQAAEGSRITAPPRAIRTSWNWPTYGGKGTHVEKPDDLVPALLAAIQGGGVQLIEVKKMPVTQCSTRAFGKAKLPQRPEIDRLGAGGANSKDGDFGAGSRSPCPPRKNKEDCNMKSFSFYTSPNIPFAAGGSSKIAPADGMHGRPCRARHLPLCTGRDSFGPGNLPHWQAVRPPGF
ncbi:thiamine pyrophosphate-dependent enzyme [Rhizobium leguminosarum]|uniref:thiamine pyrophosphate-dependent enzyme n=1 Tax=Rhizobium leguminosarum TaxID=384 RepID=UPI000F79F915